MGNAQRRLTRDFTREENIDVPELHDEGQLVAPRIQERERNQPTTNLNHQQQPNSEEEDEERNTTPGPRSGSDSTRPEQDGLCDTYGESSQPVIEALRNRQDFTPFNDEARERRVVQKIWFPITRLRTIERFFPDRDKQTK